SSAPSLYGRSVVRSSADRGQRRVGHRGLLALSSEALTHVERDRDDEDGDERRRQHPPDDGRAQNPSGVGAGALRDHERKDPEDEGERGHEDGAQADTGPGQRGIDERGAALEFFLGELDDQDGVLGGQADHHHQADLREYVQLVPAEPQRAHGAQDGDGRAEQDAERQRPALVLGGQEQEYHEQREAEDGGWRDAF